LFDSLVKRGTFTEYDAARIMRGILLAIEHCHNMGVMHRDIKLESFLLADCSYNATIKLAGLGTACFFKVGEVAATRGVSRCSKAYD
jgi:serine/threonine protein kinase